MTDKFVLDEAGNPVPEHDLIKWARWFETADRRVALTQVGEKVVSTVFLGLDHSHGGPNPLLFETLVFPNSQDMREEDGRRYTYREDALKGHAEFVARLKRELQ
jgi:hypothetical protein